jgi:hypothetical protein
VDVEVGPTYLIQKLYESFQIGSSEALNVWPQVLAAEKFVKEWPILRVRGVKPLELSLDARNRWRHVANDQYSGTLGGTVCVDAL